MALLARARRLEAEGHSVVHMEIGEPDFVTPRPIVEAGMRALDGGQVHYTPATGLPQLRDALAGYYRDHFGVEVDPRRILVTPGASGALMLALALFVESGVEVMMTDPGYPCNRNFVYLFDGTPVAVPVGAEQRYQLTPALLQQYWSERTRCLLVASPSNPTGTRIESGVLSELHRLVRARGGHMIVDEIYQSLYYGERPQTALALGDDLFVINSFSKYFGMTGWRLGWLVAPPEYVERLDVLAQNLYLAAPTPAQHAALAAFTDDSLEILEQRRHEYRRRRDYLLPALRRIGFDIPVEPDGAFYLYADCSRFSADSFAFANALLEEAGVALTPGIDFGRYRAETHLRIAYTTSQDRLQEGVERIAAFVDRLAGSEPGSTSGK